MPMYLQSHAARTAHSKPVTIYSEKQAWTRSQTDINAFSMHSSCTYVEWPRQIWNCLSMHAVSAEHVCKLRNKWTIPATYKTLQEIKASEVPNHLPNTQRKLLHDLMMNFNSNITTLSRKKKGSFFAGTKWARCKTTQYEESKLCAILLELQPICATTRRHGSSMTRYGDHPW